MRKKRLIASKSYDNEIIDFTKEPTGRLKTELDNFCKTDAKDMINYGNRTDEEMACLEDSLEDDKEFLFALIEIAMEDYEYDNDVTISNDDKSETISDLVHNHTFLKNIAEYIYDEAEQYYDYSDEYDY